MWLSDNYFLFAANVDFRKNPNDIYMFSNSTPVIDCIQVTIEDDQMVEANETFSVRLNAGASSEFVFFTRQEADITIKDNDCE